MSSPAAQALVKAIAVIAEIDTIDNVKLEFAGRNDFGELRLVLRYEHFSVAAFYDPTLTSWRIIEADSQQRRAFIIEQIANGGARGWQAAYCPETDCTQENGTFFVSLQYKLEQKLAAYMAAIQTFLTQEDISLPRAARHSARHDLTILSPMELASWCKYLVVPGSAIIGSVQQHSDWQNFSLTTTAVGLHLAWRDGLTICQQTTDRRSGHTTLIEWQNGRLSFGYRGGREDNQFYPRRLTRAQQHACIWLLQQRQHRAAHILGT